MAGRIPRLRRIAEACSAGAPLQVDDAAWLGAALCRYLSGAPAGVSMEDAFGLTPPAGQATWWRIEARERRNAALRGLRERHFGSLDIPAAAREIVTLLQRASRESPSDLDQTESELVMQAVSAGASMLGPRQVANIVRD